MTANAEPVNAMTTSPVAVTPEPATVSAVGLTPAAASCSWVPRPPASTTSRASG